MDGVRVLKGQRQNKSKKGVPFIRLFKNRITTHCKQGDIEKEEEKRETERKRKARVRNSGRDRMREIHDVSK